MTEKQRKFVEAYLRHGNGTRAAREAGYKGNDNQLAVQANENLIKPKIAAALDKVRNKDRKETELTREYLLGKLKEIIEDPDRQSDANTAVNTASKILGLQNHDKNINVKGSVHAQLVDALDDIE